LSRRGQSAEAGELVVALAAEVDVQAEAVEPAELGARAAPVELAELAAKVAREEPEALEEQAGPAANAEHLEEQLEEPPGAPGAE
jgi:hypothetical protein